MLSPERRPKYPSRYIFSHSLFMFTLLSESTCHPPWYIFSHPFFLSTLLSESTCHPPTYLLFLSTFISEPRCHPRIYFFLFPLLLYSHIWAHMSSIDNISLPILSCCILFYLSPHLIHRYTYSQSYFLSILFSCLLPYLAITPANASTLIHPPRAERGIKVLLLIIGGLYIFIRPTLNLSARC